MTSRVSLISILAVAAALLHAQSAAPPVHEVASVRSHSLPAQGGMRRPWSPNIDCGPIAQCGLAGNRFTEVASLIDLIMDAYGVRRFQVSGLPTWGDSGRDIYDIAAVVPQGKPPEGATPTLDQARRMLQTLLADRFQLKLHHETKELPVYALVVTKNGSKLKPTTVACGLPEVPGGGRSGGVKGGGRALNQ